MHSGKALTVLSFDFGLKRIGIAVGDTITCTAAPRPAVTDWPGIEREVRTLQPGMLIVGAPVSTDGSPSSITQAAQGFAEELERRFGLPVHRVDERYSSLEASEKLKDKRASGARKRRVQKGDIDSAAAAVILERWFKTYE